MQKYKIKLKSYYSEKNKKTYLNIVLDMGYIEKNLFTDFKTRDAEQAEFLGMSRPDYEALRKKDFDELEIGTVDVLDF